MNAEVEVISKEIIKPSSPTPNHLRHYQLSFLDQVNPPIYTSLVLFYEFNAETQPSITDISKLLKKSLAQVLTLFYPLAGRVKLDNQFVDCNDEGVPYLEAQVTRCRLCDVLENQFPDQLYKLIPFELHDHNEFALGVQLNVFECGGFAIGLCTSHKLGDGLSMLMFTKIWAATACGDHDIQAKVERPEFVSATLFPPKEFSGFDPRRSVTINKVTKRFVFDASTIEDLRAKYTSSLVETHRKRPSRVEALSAFIWRRFVEAIKEDDDENELHTVIHIVNLRPRIHPPLPRYSFGNVFHYFITAPFISSEDDEESCRGMARQVREELSKIDKDYVKRLQRGDEHWRFINRLAQSFAGSQKAVTSYYSSLCRFPLYENDFGWRRPTWVGIPALPLKNLMVFVDTKEAGGIEAYVSLPNQDVMTKFESDALLQRRVGMSPGPVLRHLMPRAKI